MLSCIKWQNIPPRWLSAWCNFGYFKALFKSTDKSLNSQPWKANRVRRQNMRKPPHTQRKKSNPDSRAGRSSPGTVTCSCIGSLRAFVSLGTVTKEGRWHPRAWVPPTPVPPGNSSAPRLRSQARWSAVCLEAAPGAPSGSSRGGRVPTERGLRGGATAKHRREFVSDPSENGTALQGSEASLRLSLY